MKLRTFLSSLPLAPFAALADPGNSARFDAFEERREHERKQAILLIAEKLRVDARGYTDAELAETVSAL